MSASPRLAALLSAAFALTFLASAAVAQSTCTAGKYTTVCRDGERELRIIHNTVSPSGKYGVAWQPESDTGIEEWDDGSRLASGETVKNFLVRLPDGKAVATLAGDHFGDRPRYNHREAIAAWSPNSRYVAIFTQSKWTTDSSEVFLVSEAGPSKPASLMSACRAATRPEVTRRHRRGFDGYYASLDVSAVSNDGTITARCSMQLGKTDDYFAMGIRAKIVGDHNGLKVQVVGARLCGDDDERGACAPRQSDD